ncbi:hypothetical protein VB713_24870 [Anabaena cylindrica UHCC 0172]|nr:hypothetical protein [Anabaena cylindrica]MEA5554172.1 hypothetical protein [Anabaena cylindrica UHCC 0172]
MVGWVEARNPTLSRILLGFAVAQPNLHFLNRQVLYRVPTDLEILM